MSAVRAYSVSVAGIVIDDAGRVLVIQRRDNARWEPPGGILEPDETIEQGVQREVLEESGVEVEVDRLTGVYQNMTRHIVALVYRCHAVGGGARPSDETVVVRWVDRTQIDDLMLPAYAVRVHDAFAAWPTTRPHDGAHLTG